mgnify:CR=1 FL=1
MSAAGFAHTPLRQGGEWVPIERVPGVRIHLLRALKRVYYTRAIQLVGQYLATGPSEEAFAGWLREQLDAYGEGDPFGYVETCTQAIKAWCGANI